MKKAIKARGQPMMRFLDVNDFLPKIYDIIMIKRIPPIQERLQIGIKL
ncbi:MAG: hypothetical protein ACTSU6_01705 [Candidatus Njordarchaeales archaeon]